MTYWINFLHLYQPPYQSPEIINQVVKESYWNLIEILKRNPQAKMTINISGSLIEHLINTQNQKIFEEFKNLAAEKQIELTASACYHPILPLLPEKEIIRQIQLNDQFLKQVFGRLYRPRGFYLPEMAYSLKAAKILKKLGFKWLILDEISYNGKFNQADWQKKYKIKEAGLLVVFRNRTLSKTFVPEAVLTETAKTAPPKFIITATDGEMYGHHHKGEIGRELFNKVLENQNIKTLTVSQYLKKLPAKAETVTLHPASWETTEAEAAGHLPYILWHDPKNRIHKLLWELRKLAIRIINRNLDSPNFQWARHHLDRGLASCAWWWASEKKPDIFSPITWNPDEIEKGIKELISSIRSLTNITPETKLKAEKIYQQLIKEVWSHHWKKYHPSVYAQTKDQLGRAFYLLDQKYLIRLFSKKLRSIIKKRGKITKLTIDTYKNNLGSKTFYHIVARYHLFFAKTENQPIHIFCNANSRESRAGAFAALKYIWQRDFKSGKCRSPQPLFYQPKLKAMFYYELPGEINLYQLISQKKSLLDDIKKYIKLAAGWLKKLHQLPVKQARNFNPLQSRVETVIPGPKHFLAKISEKHPNYPQLKIKAEKLFNLINQLEKKNLARVKKVIIHGDYHPENVIIAPYGKNSVGVIDYTDTCLGDPTRDLANFLQQFGWMFREFLTKKQIERLKKLFLQTYFGQKKLSWDLKNRLLLYQAWTALRSAIYFLTIRDFDIPVANKLIRETKSYLKEIKEL